MNGNTLELHKFEDGRSLVLWEHGRKEFVVCSGYDSTMPVGQQWYWGHYFNDLVSAVHYAENER